MKKILTILIVLFFCLFIYLLGPYGFKHPTNYEECVKVGGRTNIGQMRVQNECRYNLKTFGGAMI